MEELFQKRFRIPSARASWHNYREGMYFITICTHQQKTHFGRIIPRPGLAENQLVLTEVGRYVEENLQQITSHYPYAEIPVFVIMPNHLHFIIIIDSADDSNGNDDSTCRDVACNVSDIPSDNLNGNVARNHSNDTSNRNVARNHSNDTSNRDVARNHSNDTSNRDVACNHSNDTSNRDVARNVSTGNGCQIHMKISPQKGSLSTVIRGFKSAITKYARERGIAFAWQTRFYDRIIRNQNELNAIATYIENNPYK